MKASDAKQLARQFVIDTYGDNPGFGGAFLHGSITWLDGDTELADTSDLDVILVLDGPDSAYRPGKIAHDGVLLDISTIPRSDVASAETILGQYHLASSFRAPGILVDPDGTLAALQRDVAEQFAIRHWVCRRVEHARERVLRGSIDPESPFPDQVIAWVFPAGVLTHLLLVAGLRNPTVRRRYQDVRILLHEYGHESLYTDLLDVLGATELSKSRARYRLKALEEAFDTAIEVIRSPFPFAADISGHSRPVAIDGSLELIEAGEHREAVFWLVVTWSRCQQVFWHDGDRELYDRFDRGYRALLGDLGITSPGDLTRRKTEVRALLPKVWDTAMDIIDRNPGVEE